MLYSLIRPLLFKLSPERAHKLTLSSLSHLNHFPFNKLWQANLPAVPCRVMGIDFASPIGLAAGLDKNADHLAALGKLGFGFIEVGTVTPRPQAGNPLPRLFRLPKDHALINRMGFNNKGVDHLVAQVKASNYQGVLGINIGKNADTLIEEATEDYLTCFNKVYAHADYVTINISSPNTRNLRQLQENDALGPLLSCLKTAQAALATQYGRYVPLVVKIAPDLNEAEVQSMGKLFLEHEIDGIIATNTTLSREGVTGALAQEMGGLSGAPLTGRATAVIRALHHVVGYRIPLIASGGVMSGEDAREKFAAGASLVQVYTGLIYRGPALLKEIAGSLIKSKV